MSSTKSPLRRAFPQTVGVLGLLALGGRAAAQPLPPSEKDESADRCIGYHRQAQAERRAGRLLGATEELRRCLTPECSPILRDACAALLTEVERDTPSVVFAAESEKGDLADVSVFDGEQCVATSLDGVPLRLDPGEHVITFRAEGMVPVTSTVVLRVGDHNRRIAVAFAAPTPTPIPPSVAPLQPETTVRPPLGPRPPSHPSHTVDYLLIGSGAALGVAGAILGLSARHDYTEAEASCAPFCSESRRDAIREKSLIADGLFVLSTAAVGYGLFRLFLTHHAPHAATVWLGPGSLSAQAAF